MANPPPHARVLHVRVLHVRSPAGPFAIRDPSIARASSAPAMEALMPTVVSHPPHPRRRPFFCTRGTVRERWRGQHPGCRGRGAGEPNVSPRCPRAGTLHHSLPVATAAPTLFLQARPRSSADRARLATGAHAVTERQGARVLIGGGALACARASQDRPVRQPHGRCRRRRWWHLRQRGPGAGHVPEHLHHRPGVTRGRRNRRWPSVRCRPSSSSCQTLPWRLLAIPVSCSPQLINSTA